MGGLQLMDTARMRQRARIVCQTCAQDVRTITGEQV